MGCSGSSASSITGDGGVTDARSQHDTKGPSVDAKGDVNKPDGHTPDAPKTQDAPGAGTDGGTDGSSPSEAGGDVMQVAETGPSVPDGGDQACTTEAHALCSLRNSCSNGFLDKNFPSEMSCETRTAAACEVDLSATGNGQTPAKVSACGAAYPNEACSDLFDNNPVAACVPPAGTGATGAPCGVDAQCTSTFCAIGQYAICGTCQPLPALGALCHVEADCGRDVQCVTPDGAAAGTCAAFVQSAGACLTNVKPCVEGLACVGDDVTTMTMGTCQTAGATVGVACDTTRKTKAPCNADLGLVCIPTAAGSGVGTCKSITLVAPLAACGDIGAAPITGFADCQAGGLCKKAAATDTTGTCVATAADGAACDNNPASGPPCLSPAKCVVTGEAGTAGTCRFPDAAKCM